MSILWFVNSAEIPLMIKKLETQADPKRDWCQYRPENKLWKKAHGVDWIDLGKAVAFVLSFWALAIWLSCK